MLETTSSRNDRLSSRLEEALHSCREVVVDNRMDSEVVLANLQVAPRPKILSRKSFKSGMKVHVAVAS